MKNESWHTYFASALSVRYASAVAKEHGGVNPSLLIEQAAALADAASAFVSDRAQREAVVSEAVPMARYSLDVNTSADILETLDPLGDWVKFSDIPQPVEVRPVSEPYGHVTTHSVTGQQFFYRYPERPYLDNAKECVAVYAAAQPVEAQPVARNDKYSDLLSMAIGMIMGQRKKIGYTDNSPIAKLVAEAVEYLKDWPFPESAQPVAREPISEAHVRTAAKYLAEKFDYPWEYMPEDGRRTMREHVLMILAACGIKPTSAEGGETC